MIYVCNIYYISIMYINIFINYVIWFVRCIHYMIINRKGFYYILLILVIYLIVVC